jgi:hypothetical protein
MKASDFYRRYVLNHKLVYVSALLLMGAAIMMSIAASIDTRTVHGINTWFKPIKFAVSIAVFVATLPIITAHIRIRDHQQKKLLQFITVCMMAEFCLITIQAALAQPSHYNTATAFDLWIFNFMGVFIGSATLGMVVIALLFFHPQTKPEYIRNKLQTYQLALLLFLFASAVGARMIGNMSAHTGYTTVQDFIPFLGWSKTAGDFRIAHFAGMHALQVLPFVVSRFKSRSATIFTFIYITLVVYASVRAFMGLTFL